MLIIHVGTSPEPFLVVFFFNDTATTEIYTLSLHDALPISSVESASRNVEGAIQPRTLGPISTPARISDRKSTRLNSSHANISYAVFCLKKKKQRLCCVELT